MTMDIQTVFIGGLTLCKRDVATEVMVEVDDSDFETKELQEAFNAIKGYWELRGYVDVVDIRETHKNVADLIVECSKACEAECVVLSRERMEEWAKRIKENAA